ncbi:helix-hairpin-helix domain-containing protein [Methylobacter sp. G7]|uniref:ComEA family DNA-binding protein n=1 Tax=Methylobacter sp. G7 TaxID=3230117 RepID=UPI003D807448
MNINIASREELLTVPGINAWLVDSLISYRNTMGPYSSIWHLVFTGSWDFAIVLVFSPFLTCT